MLPLESSLDALADAGYVLETLADGIRGAILVAELQMASVAAVPGWDTSAAMPDAIGPAEAKATAIAQTVLAIRQAIYQASSEYADADRRSAQRHRVIAW